ncbi:MAG TPA: VOC family protein [Gaiellaceae bacterium]|nr:VOC family protein [Gaiellaceae bacterium]
MTLIWYRVTDLDTARAFYTGKLGFTEVEATADWATLERGGMEIALAQGAPFVDGPVASIDVVNLMAEADHLRDEQVEIGTVLELHDEVRIVDVYDPDGNRLQLVEQLRED